VKKLNQVFKDWKPNTVLTNNYFDEKNIYPQLLNKYLQSEWLERIGIGAYIKYGDKVDCFGALNAIQNQLKLPIYIGGKTALNIHGMAHYVGESLPYLELYALNNARLPKWFLNYDWRIKIHYSTTNLFGNDESGITRKEIALSSILISSPEMAILELISNLPEKVSFDETYKIMENLYNLRPELLTKLLEKCNSIKVKRTFLYLAEKIGHFWFEDLKTENINLGHGKRELIKDGILDKKYLITVPRNIDDEL